APHVTTRRGTPCVDATAVDRTRPCRAGPPAVKPSPHQRERRERPGQDVAVRQVPDATNFPASACRVDDHARGTGTTTVARAVAATKGSSRTTADEGATGVSSVAPAPAAVSEPAT